ncbi:oxidoreductase [Pseudomaricurvus alkylphenolicus]|uniref:4Fe-4S dicluster domain-containing protein n=1 Tax=Pseudomaricurvus alkylphenolicus TaxID=1306991 RepID=UPI0014204BA2|nr:4Fe-4S dicluster domain-containing protein [Pseudomaricurvus alkylphenolicus]NIB38358.1 oxidoreductase [Pseudomaricurvus alkylphenolicus]
MKKWNMIIDVAKCHNCNNCFISTKDEYCGNDHPGYSAAQPDKGHRWVDIERIERGQAPVVEANFRPVMCNHCDNAPCMAASENGAVTKRDDGIVLIDPVKARGQRHLVDACPYNAIYWNEEQQIPQAWIFDAHLLDRGWKKTRLDQVCPTGAIKTVKITDNEMNTLISAENLATLRPELDTKPRVHYKNNHLFDTLFIAGTVVSKTGDNEESVVGASVVAFLDHTVVSSATTDAFGEFKLDRLPMGNTTVIIAISIDSSEVHRCEVSAQESIYLGCISIEQQHQTAHKEKVATIELSQ